MLGGNIENLKVMKSISKYEDGGKQDAIKNYKPSIPLQPIKRTYIPPYAEVGPDTGSKWQHTQGAAAQEKAYRQQIEGRKVEEGLRNLEGFMKFSDYAGLATGAGSLLTKGITFTGKQATKQLAKRAVGREFKNQVKHLTTPASKEIIPQSIKYGAEPIKDNPSLKFFERKSKLTRGEVRGIPKGTRNQPLETDYIKKIDLNPKELKFIGQGAEAKVFENPYNPNEIIKYPTKTLRTRREFRDFKRDYVMKNNATDMYEPSYYMGYLESKGGKYRVPLFRQKKVEGVSPTYSADEESNLVKVFENSGYTPINSWTMERNGYRFSDLHQGNYKYGADGKIRFFDLNVEKTK